jgi:hypothetical protein
LLRPGHRHETLIGPGPDDAISRCLRQGLPARGIDWRNGITFLTPLSAADRQQLRSGRIGPKTWRVVQARVEAHSLNALNVYQI